MKHKTKKLCGGHNAQERRGQILVPLKVTRRRGESTPCNFPGCKYLDAPDGGGYCRHHWRQHELGQEMAPLKGTPNRGRKVLLRDEFGNKFCPLCEEWKPEAEFSRASASSDGFSHRCRRCHASAQKKAKYGIDIDAFEALLESQGGRCAICPVTVRADGFRLSIDHDHSCCPGTLSCGNCIRGLLCPDCNRGLGLFRDNIKLLKEAINYLERQPLQLA
ncbi:endonuclease VII domain-containing protein [Arthrobacter sp. NPDC058097]|uniref:endonuclease VII domain-containing protein n=1 Tax=Arthrobacter sp. NPDC058097 TaxID=3346340 RepID=UPI0036DB2C09